MTQAWGQEATQTFYSLTPDRLLHYVETASERRTTGRTFTLFSLENRVYDCELEESDSEEDMWAVVGKQPAAIAKFYRPGRWSLAQLGEEHSFLADLKAQDLSVIAPYRNAKEESLWTMSEAPIHYALFPKRRGRSIDEWTVPLLRRLGHLLARMHLVGEKKSFQHRIRLDPNTYGSESLQYLKTAPLIPDTIRPRIIATAEQLLERVKTIFDEVKPRYLRIHGDLHRANLLALNDELSLIDFDDCVLGPAMQDFWLLLPGRDAAAVEMLQVLRESYNVLRPFPEQELRLIEPLRALRLLHFNAWVLKRWEDPFFPKTFPHFSREQYWIEWHHDLYDLEQRLNDTWWLQVQ